MCGAGSDDGKVLLPLLTITTTFAIMDSMTKTLITLDVDDTISPIVKTVSELAENPEFVVFDFGYQVGIRKNVIEFLQRLAEVSSNSNGEVEVVWCSSWQDSTGVFHTRSGGQIPHFEFLELPFGVRESKSHAITEYVKNKGFERIIVCEDDRRVVRGLKKRSATTANFPKITEIHCERGVGLTDKQIANVLRMIGAKQ